MEFIILFIVGVILWIVFKEAYYAKQRDSVHYKTMIKTGPVGAQNILIDVKGNGGLVVDPAKQQVGVLRGHGENVQPTMISYRDVLSSEIIEDGDTVTKTSRSSQIGGALIGGLALGGVGAIIGGLSGSSKSVNKVSKIALMITVNDANNPLHYVMLLDDGISYKKSHPSYQSAMGEAQRWHARIQVLIRQADEEDQRQAQEDAAKILPPQPQRSLADELSKLSELRDRGVLTESEFADQKTKLLS